jgi:hypothetical protein
MYKNDQLCHWHKGWNQAGIEAIFLINKLIHGDSQQEIKHKDTDIK